MAAVSSRSTRAESPAESDPEPVNREEIFDVAEGSESSGRQGCAKYSCSPMQLFPTQYGGNLIGKGHRVEGLEENGLNTEVGKAALIGALHFGRKQQNGNPAVAGFLRNSRKVDGPSMPGIITSSRMASG